MEDQETDKACNGVMDSYFRENHLRKPSEGKMMRRVKVQRSRSMKNLGGVQEKSEKGSVAGEEQWEGRRVFTYVQRLSHVRLFATLWTVAWQAPLSMGFSQQEYWSGLPFPTSGNLPNQGSNLCLLHCRWILYWATEHGAGANSGWQTRG